MTEAQFRRQLAAVKRADRRASLGDAARFNPPQLRVRASSHRRKVLLWGRRTGKTTYVANDALETAGDPRTKAPLLYVTLTRANAKEILWPELLALNHEYELGGVPNISDLSLMMPSGIPILLRGANNERELAKIRGKKFWKVYLDERQSMPDRISKPLIGEILGPTLLDYGGELWEIGTRSALRSGHWFDTYAGELSQRREVHEANVYENDKLPRRLAGVPIDEILAEFRAENGWTEEDVTYRREVLNEDVEDTETLLYPLGPQNVYETLPAGPWTYVFGIDIGHDDSDAIAVLGWSERDRRLFLVEEHVANKQDVTDLVGAIGAMREKYRPVRMVIDQGGLGKKIAEEIRRRHHIPVQAADKAQKGAYIKLLNADIRKGQIVSYPGSRWIEDCKVVRKDSEALKRDVLQELPSKKGGFHSDITDAVLYGWREARHFLEDDTPVPPPLTVAHVEDADLARERRLAEERQRRPRSVFGERKSARDLME